MIPLSHRTSERPATIGWNAIGTDADGRALDPYHKWLGIPPAEQPPNYYRLLGLALFESDPDVIDHATEQRIVHLRTFQIGKRFDESQQLLYARFPARVAC